jgi:2-oxoglutarate ferredoxin oxidoreductase subunit alpha
MQAIFRMGVPVTGQERVPVEHPGPAHLVRDPGQQDGYSARTPDFDLMVALNAATYKKDVAEVRSGGWLLYDATWPLDAAEAARRHVSRRPARADVQRRLQGVRERILMKNIAYAGALAALLEIDTESLQQLLKEKFGRKPALMDSNQKAVALGLRLREGQLACPLPIRLETMDATRIPS